MKPPRLTFGPGILALALATTCLTASGQSARPLPPRPGDSPPAAPQTHWYPAKPTLSRTMQIERFPHAAYEPITPRQRITWFARSTAGPASLAGGIISSGFGTGLDDPHEYRGTWEGFGKRYAMRLSGISTSKAMEAGLGTLWGEDPRYVRDPDAPFGARVWNVVRMTFVARRRDATLHPGYARYAAISGSNFLSNTWREPSESGLGHAGIRIVEGFGARMAGNAFSEFWPDLKSRVFHSTPR